MTKVVLIGGPCSGKSTIINMLKHKGYDVVPEVAKDVFLSMGLPDPSNQDWYASLQNIIAMEQIKRESQFNNSKLTFLDRGIYDIIAYCQKDLGFVPDTAKKIIDNHPGYDLVFLLDQLPFVKESYRVEKNHQEAALLHAMVYDVYKTLGYDIIKIPILPPKQRLDYLLRRYHELTN